MEQEKLWRHKLSDRVIKACQIQGCREADCEPLVKQWLTHIRDDYHRPTISGVITEATRKIYKLSPID